MLDLRVNAFVSTDGENIETRPQRDIRLLRFIQQADLTQFSTPDSPPKDLLALDALKNGNFISGIMRPNATGFPVQFLEIRLTIAGRELLERLEQKEENRISLPAENEILTQKIREIEQTEHNY
jgi:hypothetical protein